MSSLFCGYLIFSIGILGILSFHADVVSAQEHHDWFLNSEAATMNLTIDATMELQSTGQRYFINYVTADLLYFPRETSRQTVKELITTPSAQMADVIIYRWDKPTTTQLPFGLRARVQTTSALPKIPQKIPFPLTDLSPAYKQYTLPTENIDSDNEEIIMLASELAAGEDDLYVVLFNLATWVQSNVDYSLNTLTAEVSQKASWVLENRYGVCDELTSLFIALARSLGIPARYVSGLAYTNWNGINDFGPHAWAEIYFPDYGWVPFDVTYGEFGYIDASHIELHHSLDSKGVSSNYEWEGRDVDLDTKKLTLEADLLSVDKTFDPLLTITTRPVKENIALGSYNLLEVMLHNPQKYYVPVELFLTKTTGLVIEEGNSKHVLLKPEEEKRLYFTLKVDETLDPSFVYTYFIRAYTNRNESSETSFKSSQRDILYSSSEIMTLRSQLVDEETKTYSKAVNLSCNVPQEVYYTREVIAINCSLRNVGNIYLRDVEVCLDEICNSFDLPIAYETIVSFTSQFAAPGKREMAVTAKNTEVQKVVIIPVFVQETPDLDLLDFQFPEKIDYGEPYQISFHLTKTSEAVPYAIILNVSQDTLTKTWQLDRLDQDRTFILNLDSSDLTRQSNPFLFVVTYADKNGNSYQKEKEIVVELTDISYSDRVRMSIYRFAQGITNFGIGAILISVFVFGTLLGLILRRKRQ